MSVHAAFPMPGTRPTRSTVTRASGRRFPRPWLAALMVFSVAVVAALGVWDEVRESETALADFADEQVALANVAASGLEAQLATVRREALAVADAAAQSRPVASSIANEYLAIRVRHVDDPAIEAPDDWHAFPLSVPVANGDRVDLLVPFARLFPSESRFAHAGALGLVLPPHGDALRSTDGLRVDSNAIRRGVETGSRSFRLTRAESAELHLPARMAMVGVSTVNAGALGRWRLAVVASASRERDREMRARWRLVLGVLLVGGLVLAFGGIALRTQRKELELATALADADARRVRDEQLERESRAATMLTLAAGMAHEVLTPLSVIAGRAEQIAERADNPDERTTRSVHAILEQSNRIREVVRGFLRFARGDAANFGPVEPERVVRSAVALVEHRFAKAGVNLRVTIDPAVPPIPGEERLLDQAIVNLLLNACDACARGGEVEVSAVHDREHVTIAVSDDGVGIGPEHAARVVEPFFSTKPSDQGSGLGLAITNEIVAIHRGTLTLEPRSPRGTRASIRMPVARQESNDGNG